MEGKYPVLDTFTVTTPSLSVVIRADDTPLPPDLRVQQAKPGNLVTVHAVEPKESIAPGAEEETGKESAVPVRVALDAIDQARAQQREAIEGRMKELRRLRGTQGLDTDQSTELKQLEGQLVLLVAQEAKERRNDAEFAEILRRSESKHAEKLYSRLGAPDPIQPLHAKITEEHPEGFIRQVSSYVTKDFTHWDKLRRRGTQTVIRRWHTYVPEDDEDTAFYARHIQAQVPEDAYRQGVYYKDLDAHVSGHKEYKLPTKQYVAPPVYIRRTGNVEKRMFDPMRQMARNVNACCCSSS